MESDGFLAEFEVRRPHLRAVALRILGSRGEADDAVQETWLRLSRTDASGIDNLGGWLTTVVSHVCLDMLRQRVPEPMALEGHHLMVGKIEDDCPGPEQEAVLADTLGAALLVVLDTLTPPERVAFVLHDMFRIRFDGIALLLDQTPSAARQLASRARRRVRVPSPAYSADAERTRPVVEAFLRAARAGDRDGLVEVLAPDVAFRPDAAALRLTNDLPPMDGAAAVAAAFEGRAQDASVALIDGRIGVSVAPQGHLLVVLEVTVVSGRIATIDALADAATLSGLEITVLGHQ